MSVPGEGATAQEIPVPEAPEGGQGNEAQQDEAAVNSAPEAKEVSEEAPQKEVKKSNPDPPDVIHQKTPEPQPKKSMQVLKEEYRLSLIQFSGKKSTADEARASDGQSVRGSGGKEDGRGSSKYSLRGSSGGGKEGPRKSSGEDYDDEDEFEDNQPNLAAESATSQAGSILAKKYKDKELHVKVQLAEEEGDEDYDQWYGEEYDGEWDEDEDDDSPRSSNYRKKKSKQPTKSAVSYASLHKNSKPAHRDIAFEAYDVRLMKTLGELRLAKSNRPILLDAYCLGLGIIDPPIRNVRPSYPDKSVVHDENIFSYPAFLLRLQELEELNSHSLQQIVLIFTADLVSHKKTWSEDCNLIEMAVAWMTRYLDADCNLLYVRTGSHAEWKDPTNPYKTDKRLMIKSLPTITVWNTEKRLAGSRLFNLDNISVLLED